LVRYWSQGSIPFNNALKGGVLNPSPTINRKNIYMPTYDYECKKCGHNFEAFQSMKDEPLKKCPECGKGVRRLINGGAAVIFKGSGFYVTDKNTGASHGKQSGKPAETTGESEKPAGNKPEGGCGACPENKCPAAIKNSGKSAKYE